MWKFLGLLIMSADGTETHSLRDMGAFIWGHIDGKNDISSIAQSILASFDISEPEAQKDLIAFVIQLLDAKLVAIQN